MKGYWNCKMHQLKHKELHFEIIVVNYDIIKKDVENALEAKGILDDLERLFAEAEEKGIDVSGSNRIYKLAKLSLDRGDYEQAFERAKESRNTYALEVKGEMAKFSYYLKQNKLEFALGLLFLIIFGFASYRLARYEMLKNRIRKLKEEELVLNQLIKLAQEQTFRGKTMEMGEYELTVEHYEKKMAEITNSLIELENEKQYALTFMSRNKRLRVERARVIELIKELQYAFVKKAKMEPRMYEMKLKSYQKRMGEIDSEIAGIEAKEALKESQGILGRIRSFKRAIT